MVSPGGRPQTPFLSLAPLAEAEAGAPEPEAASFVLAPPRTPFAAVFELERDGGAPWAPADEEAAGLLAELHDHEFDEALFELVGEATALYETRRFELETGGADASPRAAERLLHAHLAPLGREAELLIDSVSAAVGGRAVEGLAEAELEALFDRYAPGALEPSFEHFFGKLKKKLKKIAKKGLALAKKGVAAVGKLGLGPILNRLKGLVKPLLERVLKMAIGKLPPALRPHAEKLRASFLKTAGMREAPEADDPALDAGEIQREFDEEAVEVLFAGEAEEERFAAAHAREAGPEEDAVERLNSARARFAAGVTSLREGEDATPQVEEFIPAILPALKLGVKLAGRKRVVGFLAGLVGKLVQRVVGRQHAPALSRAIVDSGLRLINLEATPEDGLRVAGEAVAGTVEETVRRVAALPEYVLADERLMEGFVLEAFEAAAADLLPPVLPERVYEMRPELRGSGLGGTWVYQPLRGVTKRYQKYTRVPEALVTPQVARAVRSFGGTPLSAYLQQRFGLPPGRPVRARLHLYRAVPGTSLAGVAALERHLAGLGRETGYSAADFHPLTPEAAGYLLREPGLGAEVAPDYLADRSRSAVGQRFYRLEVEGAPIPLVAVRAGRAVPARSTELNLGFDFPRARVQVSLFLSEREAQRTAAALREPARLGTVAASLRSMLSEGVSRALSGAAPGHVCVVQDGAFHDHGAGAVRRLPERMRAGLAASLAEWSGRAIGEQLAQQAPRLVAATEEDADGVTLTVTAEAPAGLRELRDAMGGGLVDTGAGWTAAPAPEARLEVVPGFSRA